MIAALHAELRRRNPVAYRCSICRHGTIAPHAALPAAFLAGDDKHLVGRGMARRNAPTHPGRALATADHHHHQQRHFGDEH